MNAYQVRTSNNHKQSSSHGRAFGGAAKGILGGKSIRQTVAKNE